MQSNRSRKGLRSYYSNTLQHVTNWASRQTSFAYDPANRLTNIIRPNGTVRQPTYDDDGEVTSILGRTASGALIAFFNLNWTNAGRVQWEFAAPLPHAYTPPSRTMTFDDDNRLTSFNGQNVLSDADGNMTFGPLPGGMMNGYSFNARNQLLNLSAQPASVAASFCYTGTTNIGFEGGAGNTFGPVNLGTPNGPLVLGVPSFGGVRNNFSGWVGCEFTTGPAGMLAMSLGRWVLAGNSGAHTVKLVNASGADVPGAVVTVTTSGTPAGQFAWALLTTPVTLAPNSTYFLLSLETSGGDQWYDSPTQVIGQGTGGYAYDPAGNRTAITNGAAVTRFVINPNAALSQVLIRTKPDGSQTFYVYGNGLLCEDNFDPGGTEQNTRTYHFDYRGAAGMLGGGSTIV